MANLQDYSYHISQMISLTPSQFCHLWSPGEPECVQGAVRELPARLDGSAVLEHAEHQPGTLPGQCDVLHGELAGLQLPHIADDLAHSLAVLPGRDAPPARPEVTDARPLRAIEAGHLRDRPGFPRPLLPGEDQRGR